jgi:hypothetical protein
MSLAISVTVQCSFDAFIQIIIKSTSTFYCREFGRVSGSRFSGARPYTHVFGAFPKARKSAGEREKARFLEGKGAKKETKKPLTNF